MHAQDACGQVVVELWTISREKNLPSVYCILVPSSRPFTFFARGHELRSVIPSLFQLVFSATPEVSSHTGRLIPWCVLSFRIPKLMALISVRHIKMQTVCLYENREWLLKTSQNTSCQCCRERENSCSNCIEINAFWETFCYLKPKPPPLPRSGNSNFFPTPPGNISISCLKRKIS